jgi:glycerol-3-phosphate O-acyltransferase/dihydroxyacetone phosphate acyltransferase
MYRFMVWFFKTITYIFFDDIEIVGQDKIPLEGPIIFVGNHQNQFVDGALLMAHCVRQVSFLVAAASMRRPLIGDLARACRSIPVERPQDVAVTGCGVVTSSENEVIGEGTKFTTEFVVGDSICVKGIEPALITEIVSDEKLILKSPLEQPVTEQVPYKIYKKVDQSNVYQHVWSALGRGDCIGIFPEGGSHDRTELLPLKAGVTLMALGAVDKYKVPVKIVPCGLNYFFGHKFRSRVALEFGEPYEILPESELVEQYRHDKRSSCAALLETITARLRSVTLNTPDYKVLQAIHAARRLYQPPNVKLPIEQYLQLNRRFAEGYIRFSEHPNVKNSIKELYAYMKELKDNGLRDYQVATVVDDEGVEDEAKEEGEEEYNIRWERNKNLISPQTFYWNLLVNFFFFVLLFLVSLPGTLLNAPVGYIIREKARKKAREAVRSSTVKIRGNDVVASTKVLTALWMVPLTYTIYATLAGLYTGSFLVAVAVWLVLPFFSYISIRVMQRGVFTWRALLAVRTLARSEAKLRALQKERRRLVRELHKIVNELGPQLGPEVWENRVISPEELQRESHEKNKPVFYKCSSYLSNTETREDKKDQ